MDDIVIILILLVLICIFFEFYNTQESFEIPSNIYLSANSENKKITLYWSRPNTNYEDIYLYLVYVKEPNKSVRIITQKAGNEHFYKKTFLKLDPK